MINHRCNIMTTFSIIDITPAGAFCNAIAAAANGDADAAGIGRRITDRMTPAETAEAERRARAWRPRDCDGVAAAGG